MSSRLADELAGWPATGSVSILSTLSDVRSGRRPECRGRLSSSARVGSGRARRPRPAGARHPRRRLRSGGRRGSAGGHFFFTFGILSLAAGLLLPGLLRRLREHTLGRPAPFLALSVSPD